MRRGEREPEAQFEENSGIPCFPIRSMEVMTCSWVMLYGFEETEGPFAAGGFVATGNFDASIGVADHRNPISSPKTASVSGRPDTPFALCSA